MRILKGLPKIAEEQIPKNLSENGKRKLEKGAENKGYSSVVFGRVRKSLTLKGLCLILKRRSGKRVRKLQRTGRLRLPIGDRWRIQAEEAAGGVITDGFSLAIICEHSMGGLLG